MWCSTFQPSNRSLRVMLSVAVFSAHLLSCFFFSSRRRHTRFDCDWSSDVCSSDLTDSISRLKIEGTALEPIAILGLARLCERAMDARAAILAERDTCPKLFEIVAALDRKSVV